METLSVLLWSIGNSSGALFEVERCRTDKTKRLRDGDWKADRLKTSCVCIVDRGNLDGRWSTAEGSSWSSYLLKLEPQK